MKKLSENIPPLKKSKQRKKSQEEEDQTKRKLQTASKKLNDWKCQIHWNKFEWVNPINRNEQNNPFCVSSKIFYMKDNNKNAHWVGHAKLNPLDIDKF